MIEGDAGARNKPESGPEARRLASAGPRTQNPAVQTLILGAGNVLLSDEGFGVHFIRHLEQRYRFCPEVTLLDAGTLGMLVTHELERAGRVYMIDTVLAEGPPGTLLRYAKPDFMLQRLPLKLSPHQAGLQEMLLVSELRGRCPADIYLLGVIPHSLEPGCALSPVLQPRLEELAERLVAELRGLGLAIAAKEPGGPAGR